MPVGLAAKPNPATAEPGIDRATPVFLRPLAAALARIDRDIIAAVMPLVGLMLLCGALVCIFPGIATLLRYRVMGGVPAAR